MLLTYKSAPSQMVEMLLVTFSNAVVWIKLFRLTFSWTESRLSDSWQVSISSDDGLAQTGDKPLPRLVMSKSLCRIWVSSGMQCWIHPNLSSDSTLHKPCLTFGLELKTVVHLCSQCVDDFQLKSPIRWKLGMLSFKCQRHEARFTNMDWL